MKKTVLLVINIEKKLTLKAKKYLYREGERKREYKVKIVFGFLYQADGTS